VVKFQSSDIQVDECNLEIAAGAIHCAFMYIYLWVVLSENISLAYTGSL